MARQHQTLRKHPSTRTEGNSLPGEYDDLHPKFDKYHEEIITRSIVEVIDNLVQ